MMMNINDPGETAPIDEYYDIEEDETTRQEAEDYYVNVITRYDRLLSSSLPSETS